MVGGGLMNFIPMLSNMDAFGLTQINRIGPKASTFDANLKRHHCAERVNWKFKNYRLSQASSSAL